METSKSIILGALRNVELLEWVRNIAFFIIKFTNLYIYIYSNIYITYKTYSFFPPFLISIPPINHYLIQT